MKIVQRTDERLVLRGVPGRAVWMVALAVLGVALMLATAAFAVAVWNETHDYKAMLPLAIGFVMGLALSSVGVVTLAVARQSLTLDRTRGRGDYEAYSPIVETGKPFGFDLDQIDSLEIETRGEAPPGGDGFDVPVARLRLRIRSPRRVVVLDETSNGRVARIERLGAEVADWLGVDPPTV